jgi:aspartyl-tRNA(Asn)/glutamyl-tRNA(Gln) amidotransferase subunit A
MPSMAVPVSFDADGMPAGVQFVGLPWSEETLLELAVRFEEARGVFPSPPLGTPISRSALNRESRYNPETEPRP